MKKRFLRGISLTMAGVMLTVSLTGCGVGKNSHPAVEETGGTAYSDSSAAEERTDMQAPSDAATAAESEYSAGSDEAYDAYYGDYADGSLQAGSAQKREKQNDRLPADQAGVAQTDVANKNMTFGDIAAEAQGVTADGYDDLYNWNNEEAYSDSCMPYEAYPVNTEEYEKAAENGFLLTAMNPLSTFSADVDTASYANVRRMIEDGYTADMIDPAAVRPEEFINYFSYDLKKPKMGDLFGVTTEVAPCAWNQKHELMMVGITTKEIDMSKAPDSNLVFLLDVSGSMRDDDKLPLLQKAFKELTGELGKNDTVSIVTYASDVETVLAGVNGTQKEKICAAIDGLRVGGNTYGEGGIQRAYELAEANFIKGGNNRVIMATDGDLNVGISDPAQLEAFIQEKKKSGVALSVLGFGTGNLKDNNMERLADCGNGNYAYIDSVFEAKKVLVEEMGATLLTIAEDVKLQVEFNPQKVNAYRLIGYENRMMDAMDFYDDKKDAGEIGAGHSVVALYEIVPAGSQGEIRLKYQDNEKKNKGSSTDYATVSIRYKKPGRTEANQMEQTVSKSSFTKHPSESFIFASLVAEFAMLLIGSDDRGGASYEHIIRTYQSLDENDEYKNEFYYLVKQMAKR